MSESIGLFWFDPLVNPGVDDVNRHADETWSFLPIIDLSSGLNLLKYIIIKNTNAASIKITEPNITNAKAMDSPAGSDGPSVTLKV